MINKIWRNFLSQFYIIRWPNNWEKIISEIEETYTKTIQTSNINEKLK